MSSDGRLLAFTVLGQPANRFVLFDTSTQAAFVIEAPPIHRSIGGLQWSPDGDELTFVTGNQDLLSGEAQHVWRLRPGLPAPAVALLARIPCVSEPMLSADGERLLTLEAIRAEVTDRCNAMTPRIIVERRLTDGIVTQRSVGQSDSTIEVIYDRDDTIYTHRWRPQFLTVMSRRDRTWKTWSEFDSNGRSSVNTDDGLRTFRVMPGETLAEWPAPHTPADGERLHLMGALDDGRPVFLGHLEPTNPTDWYDASGRARTQSRELRLGFLALSVDGSIEVLRAEPVPQGGSRTGGVAISGDTRFLAQVISTNIQRGVRPGGEVRDHRDMLRIFEGEVLAFESLVAGLTRDAPVIALDSSSTPLMPVANTEARVAE